MVLEEKKKKTSEDMLSKKNQITKKKEYTEAEIDEFIDQLSRQVNRNISYKFMFNHYKQMLKDKWYLSQMPTLFLVYS